MAFACIYVPDFMAQAMVRGEPALRRRPVAIVEGVYPLGLVVAVNEKARRAGVQVGMAKSRVESLALVQLRLRSPAREAAAHAALLDLGWSFSPRLEDIATDTVVLDLAGLRPRFGDSEKIACRLAERAAEFGLKVHVAVAAALEVALCAARGFPGIKVIPPGEEAQRLGGLPIAVLAPPAEILETLDRWGVRTWKALAALPAAQLSERLGQAGVRLQELARGTSARPLVPVEPALRFEETMELEDPVGELEPLSFILGRLLDQLCARLAARALAAHELRLILELEHPAAEDFPAEDQVMRKTGPSTRYERAIRLPVPMRDSKTFLKLWRLHLQSDPPPGPIGNVAIAAEPARPRLAQGGLFIPLAPDPEKWEVTLARLAHLVGPGNVGSPELVDTHRPGAFRMRRFHPAECAAEARPEKSSRSQPRPFRKKRFYALALRIFRLPLPAAVETRGGVPARICFRGLRGDVVAASGPWRILGGWWSEDGWAQDDWDVELHFAAPARSLPAGDISRPAEGSAPRAGVYRVYRQLASGRWFIRGAYD